MTAPSDNVIPLPWVRSDEVRPALLTVKSIMIRREGRCIAVVMHPALTGAERRVREVFGNADVARAYARRIHTAYPDLYRRIIDETGDAA